MTLTQHIKKIEEESREILAAYQETIGGDDEAKARDIFFLYLTSSLLQIAKATADSVQIKELPESSHAWEFYAAIQAQKVARDKFFNET